MTERRFISVRLTKPVPFKVILAGEIWEVAIAWGGKNGSKECLYAECVKGKHRTYLFSDYGRRYSAQRAAVSGFAVERGTPMHGLVTAMRRAGVAELS